jgi:hypothetical protein
MNDISHPQEPAPQSQQKGFNLSEDWLSVILAFLLILLAAIGVLGKTGIPISF